MIKILILFLLILLISGLILAFAIAPAFRAIRKRWKEILIGMDEDDTKN